MLREYAEAGTDLIVGEAFGISREARKVADDYPGVAFLMGDPFEPHGENFAVFDNYIHEPCYLMGMIAGSMTTSNRIGMVGGYPIGEVNRLFNAFMAGARETNPEVEFKVTFIGSWFDPPKAKEAAFAQVEAGVDVLYAERGGRRDAAREKGHRGVRQRQRHEPGGERHRRRRHLGAVAHGGRAGPRGGARQGRHLRGRGLPRVDDDGQGRRLARAPTTSSRTASIRPSKRRSRRRRRPSSPASTPSRSSTTSRPPRTEPAPARTVSVAGASSAPGTASAPALEPSSEPVLELRGRHRALRLARRERERRSRRRARRDRRAARRERRGQDDPDERACSASTGRTRATVRVGGTALAGHAPRDALAAGVGMVHQHFTLAGSASVLDNVVLGTESLWRPASARRAARARLERLVADTGLAVPLDARVSTLAVGERQRVEILKALYRDVRVLVLDEPTAVLTPQEADELFARLRAMAGAGLAVVVISHKLHEVMAVSDRVVVLRGGRVAGAAVTAEVDRDALASMIVGRAVTRPVALPRAPGEVLLDVRGVDVAGGPRREKAPRRREPLGARRRDRRRRGSLRQRPGRAGRGAVGDARRGRRQRAPAGRAHRRSRARAR